jgi:hypothetical protein
MNKYDSFSKNKNKNSKMVAVRVSKGIIDYPNLKKKKNYGTSHLKTSLKGLAMGCPIN